MSNQYLKQLEAKLDQENYARLAAIDNEKLHALLADAVALCEPDKVFISTDSPEDIEYTRKMAMQLGEERALALEGHTIHYDGMEDQGRDRTVTKYLVPEGDSFSKALNQMEREEGLAEVRGFMKGCMKGRTMAVRFMTLGPNNSEFSIPCVECTDSFYVSHSLNLLYRLGYEEFKRLGPKADFFATLHSSGKLDDRNVSAEVDKKRIYIDHTKDIVYSVNTQYAGNTVGLKKLNLRLTIQKAYREGWLAEHMFLMAVHGAAGRKTYFAGAFPSACGKTSTAMLPGETIVGDDISYFRAMDGKCMATNAEAGIFGIIQNVTAEDDPLIWDVLNKPGEVIFTNVLVKDGKPYWLGMNTETPKDGENFSGAWEEGKLDAKQNKIPLASKNARYTVALHALKNCDSELENSNGVELAGIMYGGRDALAYVPCQQGFGWDHGIICYGASLETETTFATVGQEGLSEINLMSIQDFIAIPLGDYIRNYLSFAKKLNKTPLVFGVNYFLRRKEEDGKVGEFVNGIRDKHVWVKWMELRVHGEAAAVKAPTGYIPCFEDLERLFKEVLGKTYTRANYIEQFTIRIPENLAKLERVKAFHHQKVADAPPELFQILAEQEERLRAAEKTFGPYPSPECFPVEQ